MKLAFPFPLRVEFVCCWLCCWELATGVDLLGFEAVQIEP